MSDENHLTHVEQVERDAKSFDFRGDRNGFVVVSWALWLFLFGSSWGTSRVALSRPTGIAGWRTAGHALGLLNGTLIDVLTVLAISGLLAVMTMVLGSDEARSSPTDVTSKRMI
jgi:hypothetical protein